MKAKTKLKKFQVSWSIFTESGEYPHKLNVKAIDAPAAKQQIINKIAPDASYMIKNVEAL